MERRREGEWSIASSRPETQSQTLTRSVLGWVGVFESNGGRARHIRGLMKSGPRLGRESGRGLSVKIKHKVSENNYNNTNNNDNFNNKWKTRLEQ